jgi:hypothetical protein
LEDLNLPDRTHALEDAGTIKHGDSCRVIAAVLEPTEPFDEDWNDVTLSDGADDSAHGLE